MYAVEIIDLHCILIFEVHLEGRKQTAKGS